MNSHQDSILAIVAAIFVLFTAMIDPRFSSGLAIGLLIAFAVYKIIENRSQQSQP
jgi:Ca2+/Na+ antiporter